MGVMPGSEVGLHLKCVGLHAVWDAIHRRRTSSDQLAQRVGGFQGGGQQVTVGGMAQHSSPSSHAASQISTKNTPPAQWLTSQPMLRPTPYNPTPFKQILRFNQNFLTRDHIPADAREPHTM